ncbi:MAG: response regulator, partial [Planctomycetia bacterium]|nr:response regulator [Planctomycetia bacterium]
QGSVTLRVANEPGSVDSARPSIRFSVTDTGVGIPTDRRHRLFHAFSQVDASTTRRFGGTGLGLAICRQLVEALGGQIGVESCVGEGSTFWMVLPLEVVEGRQSAPVELPLGLSASNVLVLDDNQTNLEILHDQLTNWGLHTDLHTSPELALASLRTAAADGHPFEIAILDGLLPQTTGVEMAEAIRQDPLLAHTRLLLLTSQHHGLPMDEAEKLGMTVLHKPVRQSRLYDALLNLASDGNTRRNAVQTADQAAASTPTVTGGGQVLIVDDNEINRIVAEEIVISAGHRATLVSGGYEAIEALRQRRFDLVLMDCEMPELDGFIATEEIRRLEAAGQLRHQKEGEMMIVALTAQAVAGDHERCLAAGMNDYLTKPIDRRKLLAVLAAIRPGETTSRPRRELRPSRSAGKPHVENRMETAEKAIDLDDLSQRCGGKTDFVTRVLSRFRDDAVRRRTELSQALTPDELNRLAREAHAIKGAAANVSARTVSHAAGVLEQAAKNGQLEACRDAEAALQQSLDHCLEQIDLLLSEETKTL